MSRNRPRYPLDLIRDVLDYATTTSNYAAARHYGLQQTTIRRWQLRAMREHTGWPTADDIAAWHADDQARAATRSRGAAQTARWRNRVYLNRGPLWIDATGTTRRLRALVALGWTQLDRAERYGASDQYLSLLTRGDRHPKVHIDTANRVRTMYEQLCMTVPAHRPAWVHDRQRRYAARRGWAPPLAWDGDDIDNPQARPVGAEYAA